MGVYIKNFKMPPPGKYRACVIVDEFGARLTVDVATSYADHDLRVDPLVPVPPHGRLSDADKIYDAVEQRYRISSGAEHRCERDLLDLICSAPTIIPAEEAEE